MEDILIETHPFPPFINSSTELLIMGTFPPQPKRWSMEFYYPNRTNDFWYIMGLIFFNDRYALCDKNTGLFNLEKIKNLLIEKKIGMSDTGYKIRRLQDNASDKYLEILEPIPLREVLHKFPSIKTLCTTGEKAAKIISELTATPPPAMGQMVISGDGLNIWRMPSTSRAYPLAIDKKAAYYAKMFQSAGILSGHQ